MAKRGWILAGWLVWATTSALANQMSIQVQTGQLRETPSFLGRVVATANYADRVTVIAKQGVWSQVRHPNGQTGWIHESALTRERIVLRAGAQDVHRTASGEELAMAGKGFNSQVEAEFRDKNREVDFTWIDRMEAISVAESEIMKFLREGGLPQ
ncbi:MAG TPA: SH3 domain-containing protein [Kiritimatiellia bacterium]|nr:SH3 domain-containing protein [Kiritimatiellia bacterium]HMO97968.1 SH3 domain-containing protein [Kiritimatiellia bacterium]HMP95319.1 SH3 domain-containing protein [Kiritimatiellia bacterium]